MMIVGFPLYIDSGIENDFNYLIMEYLGPSLDDIREYIQKKFSLKTLLMSGIQMVRNLIRYKELNNFIDILIFIGISNPQII